MQNTIIKTCGAVKVARNRSNEVVGTFQCQLPFDHVGQCKEIHPFYYFSWTKGYMDPRSASKEEHDTVVNGERLCSGKDCVSCEKNQE